MKKNFDIFLSGALVDLIILNKTIAKTTDWYKWFNHKKNTDYSNKICPLGNLSAYLLAIWIIITKIVTPQHLSNKSQQHLKTATKIIFTITAILAFIMNLNAFIYLIPVFIYELTL